MNFEQIETPALILDKNILCHNINKMQRHLNNFQIKFRVHGKTAKCMEIIKLINTQGITVSNLHEAEYYFSHGIKDILYAVGIAPGKFDHVFDLIRRGADLSVIVDNTAAAEMLSEKSNQKNIPILVYIEIDCDQRRGGIDPEDPEFISLGLMINQNKNLKLQGVLTHAGKSYQAKSIQEIKLIAKQERDCAVNAAKILRNQGLNCPQISIGSTPTVLFNQNFQGISEVRAGVYIFNDLTMLNLGVCTPDEMALSVLGSVIGHQVNRNQIITDTGWMSLSSDRGIVHPEIPLNFGLVTDIDGNIYSDLIVSSVNQEHGIISSKNSVKIDFNNFPMGKLIRIFPNHACATAARFRRYYLWEDKKEITGFWEKI
ncbi:MAG: hypothetical protein APR63_07165 [Desulfuromonas sp. SDB]|nr:MAG: hypothetical protein APR63_07165 [Desulfuromonas sp. SDB]